MSLVDALTALVLLAGVLLSLLAAVGLHRFPDVFARMHAATKPATLGLLLVVGTVALRSPDPADTAKLLLAVGLQFLTAPVAAHMVSRAAYRDGGLLAPATDPDELADRPRTVDRAVDSQS
ncbi:MAG: monovalent cation/H(+) antiporter subunit G [Egibacteraceae bacterium]